jgi:hypothetical protein
VADCAAGLLLIALPARVAALAAGNGTRPASTITRLLGARIAAQGVAQLVRPSTATTQTVAVVEALHGSSMVGLAVLSPRYRRPALIAAAVAGLSGAAELAATRGHRR